MPFSKSYNKQIKILMPWCMPVQTATNNTETAGTDTTMSSAFKPANINEQAIYSRAFNAVAWGMPAVNFELLHESLLKAKYGVSCTCLILKNFTLLGIGSAEIPILK